MFGKTGIRPGTKLNLTLKDASGSEKSFFTNFEQDEENDIFIIATPLTGSFILKDGDFVRIDYIDDVFYCEFQGKVLERIAVDEFQFFRVKRTTEISQSYRRDDFRLELSLDIILEQKSFNDRKEPQLHRIEGRTFDISGGGISIYLNNQIKVGDEFEVTIPFDETGMPERIPCEIRWVRRITDEYTAFDYFCGIKFLHETLDDKERMAQYIFRRQLKMNRRR